ncbi:ScbA/BarX family gamma-butyrolactone biosynthesis protein [Streptomyces venezuelae]|uniref:ScbA/BarX family gamma-butyrolactone biosynthesis protein n=1 Tax=Streptomyces venezuelae TaxID=54571 RepID=UPI0037B47BD6
MSISTLPVRTTVTKATPYALGFDQTVPRQLVHRAGVTEVFLTDGVQVEGDMTGDREGDMAGAMEGNLPRVRIAAQWPRQHALYQPDAQGFSDPMLFVETLRQAAIYTAHRFHGVPQHHRFIFCDLDFRIEEPALLRVGGAPLRVVFDGRFIPETGRTDTRLAARFDAAVEVDGRRCGQGSVRLLAVGERLYTALRRRRDVLPGVPGQPMPRTLLPAAEVGQVRPENVLLSGGAVPGTYAMHLDTGHPGFFEHACDHVPGMALIEAFRQAGHQLLRHTSGDPSGLPSNHWSGLPSGLPSGHPSSHASGHSSRRDTHVMTACAVSFDAFGELDAPVTIHADEGPQETGSGERLVRVSAVQGERTLARATSVYRSHRAAAGL